MVGYHPTICQVHIFLELYSDHFWIDLNNRAFQPITYSFPVPVVIAEDFHPVADVIVFIAIRDIGEVKTWQLCLLSRVSVAHPIITCMPGDPWQAFFGYGFLRKDPWRAV